MLLKKIDERSILWKVDVGRWKEEFSLSSIVVVQTYRIWISRCRFVGAEKRLIDSQILKKRKEKKSFHARWNLRREKINKLNLNLFPCLYWMCNHVSVCVSHKSLPVVSQGEVNLISRLMDFPKTVLGMPINSSRFGPCNTKYDLVGH